MALAAIGCGLAVLLGTRPILRRLPGSGPEIPFATLATRRFAVGCALMATAAGSTGWELAAESARAGWLVLGTAGVLLAAVDARTTWLPRSLTRAAWAMMAAAAVTTGAVGGAEPLLRMLTGAAVAGGLYFAVWLVSRGGFGFGDVRFAPLIGAATAAESFTLLLWALLLGSLVGALHGLVRLSQRQRGPFPYGPAILAGGYLALVANAALRT